MSFFAIGPEYNAITSLGIHTMGNFIFFLELILEHYAKTKPGINSLYRVRVHGWICLVTSVIALAAWLYFCCKVEGTSETDALKTYLGVNSGNKDKIKEEIKNKGVWSPFLLFIVGAFAEDFSVPGILPFAFLDPERAELVNYFGPVFFMSGAILIVLFNDVIKDQSKFKDWSAMTHAKEGKYWHGLWALNIPKYIAFFIVMWSIHGIFPSLRCIVQSRWRVMLLTMFVIIPRSTLEVAGYVGVANYAIGRADGKLTAMAALIEKLKAQNINGLGKHSATDLAGKINDDVKKAIAALVKAHYGAEVASSDINATVIGSGKKIKVKFEGSAFTRSDGGTGESTEDVVSDAKDVLVTITINNDNKRGSLNKNQNSNTAEAKTIADKIEEAVKATSDDSKTNRGAFEYLERGGADFSAFAYIAAHDMLAMFCRFFYGKLSLYQLLTCVVSGTVYGFQSCHSNPLGNKLSLNIVITTTSLETAIFTPLNLDSYCNTLIATFELQVSSSSSSRDPIPS